MSTSPIANFSFTYALDDKKLVLHSRTVMETLSHMIEEQAGLAGPGTLLIGAFQRLSLYMPELPRYRQLASQIDTIYVLGVPDVSPPKIANINLIALDAAWPLVQEWVVIASGPSCCAALLARDIEGFRPNERSQRFRGLWTTSSTIVDAAVDGLYNALGLPQPQIQRDSSATQQRAAVLQREIPLRLRQL